MKDSNKIVGGKAGGGGGKPPKDKECGTPPGGAGKGNVLKGPGGKKSKGY